MLINFLKINKKNQLNKILLINKDLDIVYKEEAKGNFRDSGNFLWILPVLLVNTIR